jgi:hypothetical protein
MILLLAHDPDNLHFAILDHVENHMPPRVPVEFR